MSAEIGYATKKRAWIIKYFAQNPDRDICVNEIYEYLNENGMDMNITTIYRNIDKLVEQGVVLKTVHGKKEQATYQYMKGKEGCIHHLHMKCEKCGRILHLDCGFMSEIVEHIGNEHGFMIDCRNSYIAGLCKECREDNGNEE